MSTTSNKTLAIFGIGGCCKTVLYQALAAGYTVNVFTRTPSKLSDISAQYPKSLNVIKGEISSIPAIKQALVSDGRVVDMVLSGIGMAMKMKGLGFTSEQPTICEDTARNILTALDELDKDNSMEMMPRGPRLVLISTTGISNKGRDIPIAVMPLYHWMLKIPHKDKLQMEKLVIESQRKWVIIRPSWLLDGKPKGVDFVRVGFECPAKEQINKEAVGYAIDREDVGSWIFKECFEASGEHWDGKIVTLTY